MNPHRLRRAGLVAALAWSSAACAPSQPKPISLHYEPTRLPARLAENAPAVSLEVHDDSGGMRFEGPRASGKPRVLKPVADSVSEALALELGRVGVPVERDGAPARLSVRIVRAAVTYVESYNLTGEIVLDAALSRASGGVVWKKRTSGRETRGQMYGFTGDPTPQLALNASLDAVVTQLVVSLLESGLPSLSAPASAPAPVAVASEPAGSSPELDALPARREPDPRAVALVIGVERYREDLPKARFAAADARLAAEYFRRVLGVKDENLALLVDDRAAKGDFEKTIEQWLPNHAAPGSKVFVYFSGHGAPDPAKGDAYLVPYDGDPTYIKQTGYSVKRLFEHLGELPAESVVVAMDSCFSGAGGRSVLASGARPLVSVRTDAPPAKVTVLSASASDQISNSWTEKGHGLFTYFLLKGLKENGSLDAGFDALAGEVAGIARRRFNSEQTPQKRGGK